MAILDPAAVRRWREGAREAERVAFELERQRLKSLSPIDGLREYAGLQDFTRSQPAGVLESGHREAARRYARVLEVYRRAARRRTFR